MINLAKTEMTEPARVQIVWEQGLVWLATVFGGYHMFLSIYKYYNKIFDLLPSFIDYALAVLLAASALGYVVFTAIRFPSSIKRVRGTLKRFLRAEDLLLLIMLIWLFFSSLSVSKEQNGNWLYNNRYSIFDFSVSVLILFPLARYWSVRYGKKPLYGLLHVILLLTTAAMVIVLITVFKGEIRDMPAGQIGMTSNIRLVINSNPNTTGAYACILFSLSLYMAAAHKRLLRAFYLAAAVVHLAILVLSNSQTSFIASSFGLAAGVYLLIWRYLTLKETWQRVVLGLIAAAVSVILMLAIRRGIFALFEAVTHFSERLGRQEVDAAREIGSGTSVSSRIEIWKFSLKAMFYSARQFFFGVTPVSVTSLISIVSDGKYDMYTHNQFLEIGVALGVPAMFVYLAWSLLMFRHCIKICFSKTSQLSFSDQLLPVVLFVLVVSNLAESVLMFYYFLPGSIYFLVSGYVKADAQEPERQLLKAGKHSPSVRKDRPKANSGPK